jgi:ribonucleotide monophosphatase NagD (HAD superfamily)
MRILDGIATLADRYDGFILDLWGVVHDGRKPYPGVAKALAALKARHKRIAFLSNAPRRAHVVEALRAICANRRPARSRCISAPSATSPPSRASASASSPIPPRRNGC